jgi:hypothetical protein
LSSSDEEAAFPELGAGGATQPVSPMPEHDSESDDDDEDVGKKKRTLKKDQREWESVAALLLRSRRSRKQYTIPKIASI